MENIGPQKMGPTRKKKIELILFYVQHGASPVQAANKAGITRTTFFKWMERYQSLRSGIEKAQGASDADLELVAFTCATEHKDMNAVKFLLEKRHSRYAPAAQQAAIRTDRTMVYTIDVTSEPAAIDNSMPLAIEDKGTDKAEQAEQAVDTTEQIIASALTSDPPSQTVSNPQ